MRTILTIASTAFLLLAPTQSWAGSMGNGSATSGMPGVSLQQFRYEPDAQKHCPGDTIVWGSSANPGIFYTSGAGPYYPREGKQVRIGGFYACAADVKKAGLKIDSSG